MTDALIHMRVPADTKARWVRDSRADGKRLTDWIVEKVEQKVDKPFYHVVSMIDDCVQYSGYQRAESAESAIEMARYYMTPEARRGRITAVLADDED